MIDAVEFSTSELLPLAAATGLLAWAVYEDMRTRKFSNRTFLIALAIGLILSVLTGGWHSLVPASLGLASGFALLLPLVLMGIVGAGDMKLMAAFGLLAGWNAVLWTATYGVCWAAIFGVIQVIVRGQGKLLLANLTTIAVMKSRQGVELHRIPFTVPLLLGWLNHLVLTGVMR